MTLGSSCLPWHPGTVISSFGNHPTSLFLFCFPFLPATPLKEPHTKELCFPAQPLLPVTAMPAMTLLVLSWWSGESRQICVRKDFQSLERPERLRSCPVWSPQTEVLTCPSHSSVKLSQPLHCDAAHDLPVPKADSSHVHPSLRCLAPGQLQLAGRQQPPVQLAGLPITKILLWKLRTTL